MCKLVKPRPISMRVLNYCFMVIIIMLRCYAINANYIFTVVDVSQVVFRSVTRTVQAACEGWHWISTGGLFMQIFETDLLIWSCNKLSASRSNILQQIVNMSNACPPYKQIVRNFTSVSSKRVGSCLCFLLGGKREIMFHVSTRVTPGLTSI